MFRLDEADLTIVMLANLGGDEEPVDATYFDAIQMAVASAAPGS